MKKTKSPCPWCYRLKWWLRNKFCGKKTDYPMEQLKKLHETINEVDKAHSDIRFALDQQHSKLFDLVYDVKQIIKQGETDDN